MNLWPIVIEIIDLIFLYSPPFLYRVHFLWFMVLERPDMALLKFIHRTYYPLHIAYTY